LRIALEGDSRCRHPKPFCENFPSHDKLRTTPAGGWTFGCSPACHYPRGDDCGHRFDRGRPNYFFQATGILSVIGGTLGVTFITTRLIALFHSLRHDSDLFLPTRASREDLVEEVVPYVRLARIRGLLAIEPVLEQTSNRFLGESLLLAMDVNQRSEVETLLAN